MSIVRNVLLRKRFACAETRFTSGSSFLIENRRVAAGRVKHAEDDDEFPLNSDGPHQRGREAIGVSRILVQSWERGVRVPSPLAARLLDTISADPWRWLENLQSVQAPRFDTQGTVSFE